MLGEVHALYRPVHNHLDATGVILKEFEQLYVRLAKALELFSGGLIAIGCDSEEKVEVEEFQDVIIK